MKIVIEFEGSAESRKKALENLKKKCTIEELKKKIPSADEVKEKIESGARVFIVSAVDVADKAISKVEELVDEKLAGEKAAAEEEDYDYGFSDDPCDSDEDDINLYELLYGDDGDDEDLDVSEIFETEQDVAPEVADVPKAKSVSEEVATLEELLKKYPEVGKKIIDSEK